MFRVLKPGGRFTISDIVADQTIPNYMTHDKEKWGDCLSGALRLSDYWAAYGKQGLVVFTKWDSSLGASLMGFTFYR